MRIGIIRSLQLIGTLVIAGPIGMVGVLNLYDGLYLHGVFFLAAAVGLVVVSEYVYTRLTDRTVGRVRRLREVRLRDVPRRALRRGSDEDE